MSISLCLCALLSLSAAVEPADAPDALLGLSIEQLGELEVTATSRRASRLAETPASVFVIHGDELRALGIRTLPEALRLAPNLQVSRASAPAYGVSARGLKTALSNKLLVLVDGRQVYTPLFAGVLWDMQDVAIAEIDRIEVVSGPGAAAWGANAVNGVINIATRRASELRGGHASAWVAEDGRGADAAQTLRAGASGAVRVHARRTERDDSETPQGERVPDRWTQVSGGVRGDWAWGAHELRLQADAFDARSPDRPGGALGVDGHSVSARWTHRPSDVASWTVHGSYDEVDRVDPLVLSDRMRTLSLEAMQALRTGDHQLAWGAGWRRAQDDSARGQLFGLVPEDRTLEWSHVFVQDDIALTARLALHAGLRFDRNPYTGTETLPTLRLSYTHDDGTLWWGALSRAVRSPSRFDRELFFPIQAPIVRGGPDFESETANVAEFGVRARPRDWITVSLTAFHHDHDGLRGGTVVPGVGVLVDNVANARVWGVEGWATLRVTGRWELALGAIELRQSREMDDGRPPGNTLRDQGNDPERQLSLRATRRFGRAQQLSVFARYIGALPDPAVDAYTQVDARWSVRPSAHVEFGIGAQNLFDERHAEMEAGGGLAQSTFGRAAFADVRIDW